MLVLAQFAFAVEGFTLKSFRLYFDCFLELPVNLQSLNFGLRVLVISGPFWGMLRLIIRTLACPTPTRTTHLCSSWRHTSSGRDCTIRWARWTIHWIPRIMRAIVSFVVLALTLSPLPSPLSPLPPSLSPSPSPFFVLVWFGFLVLVSWIVDRTLLRKSNIFPGDGFRSYC